jgi:hypothetical protein
VGKSSESPFISVDAARCGDSSLKLTSVLKGDSPDHVKAFLFRSTGISSRLPYDLDKKGALILRDIDIKEQSDKNRNNDSRRSSSSNSENDIRDKSTEKRNSRSRSSSSSSSEKAGKSKRRKSSSSASSVEGENLIQGHQNGVETTVLSDYLFIKQTFSLNHITFCFSRVI